MGAHLGTQEEENEAGPPAETAQGGLPVEGAVPEPIAPTAIQSTRTSRALVRVLPALVVLAVILVFVFQNHKDVKVSFFTLSGTLPLSVALLGSAALGALLMLALGSVRILQLRRQVRRLSKGSDDNGA